MNPGKQDIRQRLEEAVQLHRSGQRAAAIARYRQLQVEQPFLPPLLNLLGLALVQEGLVEEGLPLLSEAARRAPEAPGAWLNLAFAQLESNDLAAAEASYRRLLSLQPNHLDGLLSLAVIVQDVDLEEAVLLLRRATKAAPERALPWLRLRRVLILVGDRAGIAEAERRIEGLRLEGEELSELAAIEFEQRRFEKAAELYRSALQQRPDRGVAALGLGEALRELGDFDGALKALQHAAALAPRRFNPWIAMGRVHLAKGDRAAAADAFRQALQRKSDEHYTQHWLDAALGNPTPAAPQSFVQRVAFEMAAVYDDVVVPECEYRAPQLIAELLAAHFGDRRFKTLLDLGCGTGLVGRALTAVTRRRVGLDLTRRTLDLARRGEIYFDLIEQEAVSYLVATRELFDLIVAADMLPYIGDLTPLFEALATHLEPAGVVVLTTELLDEATERGDFALRDTGRYAHADSYLRRLATERGLEVLHLEAIDLRRERGRMLRGTLALLQRPA
jgi:predicted TPR repeat methyltransferase